MTESYLWSKKLSPLFKQHRVDATRHEDKFSLGVPDVSFGFNGINGWIELKFLPKWPSNPDAPVKFRKFKPEQRNFLVSRGMAGGHCFLLALIGNKNPREIIMWSWEDVSSIYRGKPEAWLRKRSIYESTSMSGLFLEALSS